MKQIKLTVVEFMNFKKIFKYKFKSFIHHGEVYINAEAEKLELLGY